MPLFSCFRAFCYKKKRDARRKRRNKSLPCNDERYTGPNSFSGIYANVPLEMYNSGRNRCRTTDAASVDPPPPYESLLPRSMIREEATPSSEEDATRSLSAAGGWRSRHIPQQPRNSSQLLAKHLTVSFLPIRVPHCPSVRADVIPLLYH
ncbi:hypothetical protein K458DRAFT_177516 [Lentithecium fluviatile CBS 122367]|uniref:Uncharacterized protein n=1 Tax=Lentithecium fluviatile CBS 122367 TaxID=1168545 RepID=A0A6G1IFG5_9PLEO|nr:hypothetical protein K458DRAFT_177516 [Lentithecium fluviatile CBS 122367]